MGFISDNNIIEELLNSFYINYLDKAPFNEN